MQQRQGARDAPLSPMLTYYHILFIQKTQGTNGIIFNFVTFAHFPSSQNFSLGHPRRKGVENLQSESPLFGYFADFFNML
jgi:hypothetical protein